MGQGRGRKNKKIKKNLKKRGKKKKRGKEKSGKRKAAGEGGKATGDKLQRARERSSCSCTPGLHCHPAARRRTPAPARTGCAATAPTVTVSWRGSCICRYTYTSVHTLSLIPYSPQARSCKPRGGKFHGGRTHVFTSRCCTRLRSTMFSPELNESSLVQNATPVGVSAKLIFSRLMYPFFKRLGINLSFCKIRNISLFI